VSSISKILLGVGILFTCFAIVILLHTEQEVAVPEIRLLGSSVDLIKVCPYYEDPGAEVIVNGKCVPAKATGNVNTEIPGVYFIDYDYADTNFTAATVTRTVHVVELEHFNSKP